MLGGRREGTRKEEGGEEGRKKVESSEKEKQKGMMERMEKKKASMMEGEGNGGREGRERDRRQKE